VINKILSTAVKLYLRSQVDSIEDLQLQVVGRNKQILTGYIPQVFLSCSHAVYRGLYLSQVELKASDIAFNLPEVLKKKPLKLLEPVMVDVGLKLDARDLQPSLNSSLLQDGLWDLWQTIVSSRTDIASARLTDSSIEWTKIAIAEEELHLNGMYRSTSGKSEKLCLSIGIDLADEHTLYLFPLKVVGKSFGKLKNELKIDLGTDVAIEKLTIESEQIVCSGRIAIND
jgi:hypothetical protein